MAQVAPFLVLVPKFIEERRAELERRMDEVRAEVAQLTTKRRMNEHRKLVNKAVGSWRVVNSSTTLTGGGCYAIYRGSSLIYIGSTSNLRQRLQSHWRAAARWRTSATEPLSIKVKPSRRRGDWLMIEYRLILRLCPKMNRMHNIRRQR